MADKTTSISGFLFRLEFIVVDFIENDRHIGIVCWRILEIKWPMFNFGPFLRFFIKMAAKTISVSRFLLRLEFIVLDFISHDIHIDMVCRGLFEIYGVKVQKLFK